MHPHDQAIQDFQALKPHLFTSFVRLDVRPFYSFDLFETESLLQLWLRSGEEQNAEKPFLHLSCYGVQTERNFSLLWPSSYQLQLKIVAIRHYYLQDLSFEVSCFDAGYDDYNPLFSCRRFEACLETAFE